MRRVVFRADGNKEIGYGHFVRSLGLADIIKDEFECYFAIIDPSEYQQQQIEKSFCKLIILQKDNASVFFLSCLRTDDIVVIDDYHVSVEYQQKIRSLGCKLIYIDDHNDKHYVCDVLINNIPGFLSESFHKESYTKLYLGTDYALLRKEFFNPAYRNVIKEPNTVFLAFGGSDPYNISKKIIAYIKEIGNEFRLKLLIGDAYDCFEEIEGVQNLDIYKNISADKVAELIASCEICIIPASSLLNEAACISSKILLGYFADNQKQPYDFFVNNKLAIGIDDFRNVSYDTFRDAFIVVKEAEYLIETQKKLYKYQQIDNLKNVFYNVG